MAWQNWTLWDAGLAASAFLVGAMLVRRLQRSVGGLTPRSASASAPTGAGSRPAVQIPVRSIEQLLEVTHTARLMKSVEQRMRFSAAQFERDCRPVLEAFAEFVQMLPASECHHHAQPGGLWIHALEVIDAALTFRAGIELPAGASTEDRKRQEHRWSYAVFAAAMLHDVGKPVTDLQVTLFAQDPHIGRPWIALAGAMRVNGAQFYSVAFKTPTQKDYQAHQKLAAMMLHQFVPSRLMRWLAEEGEALTQLLAYLAGEAPQGPLAEIVKKADSDSVRRNLLHGPRTRFSTAKATPLIERLMEALRRMLQEGAALPLNRPGAAGWVHDGSIWFVCARLADEVRNYLAQHESAQGVPGKDRNDRLFDTWQESGATRPSPDGGAIWRVRVECETWKSPDVLTVLCFPLEKVYEDPGQYPTAMKGRVLVEPPSAPLVRVTTATIAAPSMSATAMTVPASPSAPSAATRPASVAAQPARAAAQTATPASTAPAPKPAPVREETATAVPPPSTAPAGGAHKAAAALASERSPAIAAAASMPAVTAAEPQQAIPPLDHPPASPSADAHEPAPVPTDCDPTLSAPAPAGYPSVQTERLGTSRASPGARAALDSELLSPDESARLIEPATRLHSLPASATAAFKVGPPMRPHQKAQPRPKKEPTPSAEALMAWVAHAVGSGELKYNEDKALVHFVPEGCLILSPEIFRRFIELHRDIPESPVALLVAEQGERAYKRLQNELAQSGWTARADDENMHPYAFVKADGNLSRPASFFLLPQPQLFWNPVPQPNPRIRAVPKAKKLAVPATAKP